MISRFSRQLLEINMYLGIKQTISISKHDESYHRKISSVLPKFNRILHFSKTSATLSQLIIFIYKSALEPYPIKELFFLNFHDIWVF